MPDRTPVPEAHPVDVAPTPMARLGDERGFVLILAMITLFVVTLLIGAVVAASVDVNNTSVSVVERDRATAAADAGLQVAMFRLNTTGGSTGATGTMGNGAGYTYAVSTLGTSGSPCAGLWAQSSGRAVQQACITSTGTVDGYSVRVQDRVVGYTPASPTFPVNGIFAVTGFSTGSNFTDVGDIRSNGPISFGSASVSGNLEYVSGNAPTGITCTGSCTPVQESSALPIPTSSATSDSAYASAAAGNNDAAITDWGGLTYNATTQQVSGGNGSANPVTFPSGTYYFCDVSASGVNDVTFQAAATATASNPVIIYIDSPSRAGSTCAAGTGNFAAGKNGLTITGIPGSAAAFQIYIYGTPGCTTTCNDILSMNNGTYTNVQIYAPYSAFSAKNNVSMSGNFVIGNVAMVQNSSLTYVAGGAGSSVPSSLVNYYPSAHQICLPPTTAGGTSGTC